MIPSMLIFDSEVLGLSILGLVFLCGAVINSVAIDQFGGVLLVSEGIADVNLVCFENFLQNALHCEYMCHVCLGPMQGELLQT